MPLSFCEIVCRPGELSFASHDRGYDHRSNFAKCPVLLLLFAGRAAGRKYLSREESKKSRVHAADDTEVYRSSQTQDAKHHIQFTQDSSTHSQKRSKPAQQMEPSLSSPSLTKTSAIIMKLKIKNMDGEELNGGH